MKKKGKPVYRVTCGGDKRHECDVYRGPSLRDAWEWAQHMRHTETKLWRGKKLLRTYPALPHKPPPDPIAKAERRVVKAAERWERFVAKCVVQAMTQYDVDLIRAVRVLRAAKKEGKRGK